MALLRYALALLMAAPAALAQPASNTPVQPASAPTAPAAPAAPGADGESVRVTADEGGFRLRSADQRFDLRVRGDAQADGRYFASDEEELGTDQLYLRRARLILQGTLGGRYDFKLQPNFGQGQVEIQDAYLDARFSPAFAVQAGKFKIPLGLEWLRSPTDLALVELGLPSALVPRRDIGLMVHGAFAENRVGYELGVFNGPTDGQNANTDIGDGKDVAARVFAQPLRGMGAGLLDGLGLGFGVTVGDESGAAATPGVPSYRTIGGRSIARFRATTVDSTTVLGDGRRLRYSPQAYWFVGPVSVLAEYVVSRQEVRLGGQTGELAASAYQVQGGVFLTGERAAYGRVRPSRPLGVNGGIGAVEIAARVHGLRTDEDAFPTFMNPATAARQVQAFAVGLNWFLSAHVKVMANYERTTFELSDAAPDDAADIPSENLVLTRIQVAF